MCFLKILVIGCGENCLTRNVDRPIHTYIPVGNEMYARAPTVF